METVAWMVGREGGVTELLFDAPAPPFQISKELVFRDDAAVAETTLAIANAAWKFEKGRAEGLQAKLDLLMFEHCPDEMTAEQKANWARHQVPAQIVGAA